MTVGELIAARLHAAGVRRAYGFPGGGSNLDLIDAFAAAGIDWVLTHTETGAGFMACAEAELRDVPGVLVVGNGPGLTSAVNAVAHAALDRVPLVVISDRYTAAEAATTGHQVLDQRALLAPLVKFGATVRGEGFVATLEEAIAVALEHPRGPVHLDMPRDCAGDAVSGAPATRAHAAEPDVDAAVAVLARARRPVMLVGLEARSVPLTALAHRLGAAVLTTYKGKAAYPADDARWAGILTGGVIERPVLDAADAVLAVGLDPIELLGRPWPLDCPVVSLRAGGGDDEYLAPVARCRGPLEATVAALAERLPAREGFGEVRPLREAALAALRLRPAEPLTGWRVVEIVNELLPDATVAVDAGAHMFPATMFARARRFLISNGLATMGFAVPAAIGAALATGDTAVALTGDGGLAYHLAELETAARLGARVIVVVFNDASLSLIRIKHEANGRPRAPLDFTRSRFDLVAAGLGLRGARASDPGELRAALAAPGSALIDVQLSGAEYAETLRAIRG
jgi:acetolactate synthase-1/2/3 large subunit